jgi:exodeoxyribonuclease V beta subunit
VSQPADPGALPPGADTGILIHELVERIPLESLDDASLDFTAWWSRDELRALVEARAGASPLGGRWARACGQVAHAALTTPLPRPHLAPLPPLCRLSRPPLRELELLYPVPPHPDATAPGGRGPAFIKGILDAVIEHEGCVYGVDWKSDQLPPAPAGGLGARLTTYAHEQYGLQVRLYTLGLVRLLGITDSSSFAARFGGFFYVFLRAQPLGEGVVLLRPTWDEVCNWEHELALDQTIERLASGG